MGDRFLVVGGVAAGMSAASKAKRDAPDTEVVVFERGDWVAYGACGLPYYVEGAIEHLDDLVVLGPEAVADRGIDLRRHSEVLAVDPDAQTVTVDGDDGQYEEPYDDLLLATGGHGTPPPVPGADLNGVFTIRSLETGRALRNYVHPTGVRPVPEADGEQSAPATDGEQRAREPETDHDEESRSELADDDLERVAVLGANKIGLELVDAFRARGMEVHVFESGSSVLPAFGDDVASVLEDQFRERGVHLHLETDVERLRADGGRVDGVETDDDSVAVDAVVADLGVEPDTELATAAGIELGPTGAIATDEYGQTSDPNVFAAGDCAEKRHLLTGEPIHWPYALAANRSGRAIGRTVAGRPSPIGGIVGTIVTKCSDLEVARTGLDDEAARSAGFDPHTKAITTITRPHYYPGWSRIVVRLTADTESGRLLGASLIGEEGAAHRINAVATALHTGLTVTELGRLDFGYAPPFGPVWDPVLTAAKALGDELETE